MACGSDILFAEALIESGGEMNFVLPFAQDDFIQTSIEFAGNHWVERFEKLKKDHRIRFITRDDYNGNDNLFYFLGKVLIGAGIMRSMSFNVKPKLVMVSSESDGSEKIGGTKSIKTLWPYKETIININPDIYLGPSAAVSNLLNASEATKTNVPDSGSLKDIRYLLLATIVKTELKDDNVVKLESMITSELTNFPGPRKSGVIDGNIYAIYSKASYAIEFGLQLFEFLATLQEEEKAIRVALEAIPMAKNETIDQVIETTSTLKSVAMGGMPYATMQFATALSAEQPDKYDYHRVGMVTATDSDEEIEVFKIEFKVKTGLT